MPATLEEQVANLTKLVEELAKQVHERDVKIAKLQKERIIGSNKEEEEDDHEDETFEKSQTGEHGKPPAMKDEIHSDSSIHDDQVKKFIVGTITEKLEVKLQIVMDI